MAGNKGSRSMYHHRREVQSVANCGRGAGTKGTVGAFTYEIVQLSPSPLSLACDRPVYVGGSSLLSRNLLKEALPRLNTFPRFGQQGLKARGPGKQKALQI